MLFEEIALLAAFFVVALLYATVGHAGASTYLALMSLAGLPLSVVKPSALGLNILVAGCALLFFYRARAIAWQLLLPLLLGAIPFAYLGGRMVLSDDSYVLLLGVVLVYSAIRAWRSVSAADYILQPLPSRWCLVAIGAGIGLVSGLVGIGGGIILSPLLLFKRWAEVRSISGTAAGFILLNSLAGLVGSLSQASLSLYRLFPLWALAVVGGGIIGARLGSQHLSSQGIQRVLSCVLLLAGSKLLWVTYLKWLGH